MTTLAHSIDRGILVVFLAVNLVVRLRHSRRVKAIQDYALGGKNFSTATLTATMVATWSSGSSLFVNVQNTYAQGLYYFLAVVGLPLDLFLSAQLTIRMREFLNNVSVRWYQ
ncbi:unnamed protein product [Choristocarpus tenellus]